MDEERKFNLSVDIKEKKKSGTVLMTEGSIWKKLLIFSVPLILGNLLQQLYSTVDSIIVGNCVGKEALAAVGSTGYRQSADSVQPGRIGRRRRYYIAVYGCKA